MRWPLRGVPVFWIEVATREDKEKVGNTVVGREWHAGVYEDGAGDSDGAFLQKNGLAGRVRILCQLQMRAFGLQIPTQEGHAHIRDDWPVVLAS